MSRIPALSDEAPLPSRTGSFQCRPLLSDKCPAHDRAANGRPSPETLVNHCCVVSLVAQRLSGLVDLGIRYVAHGHPRRRLVPELGRNGAQNRIAHFAEVPESLQLERVLHVVKAEEVSS